MNYKKVIKSRKVRIKIMQMLSFIPDKYMLKFQYRMAMGRKLNINNPQRYSEKVQCYKMKYRNLEMPICADKWDVREFVKKRKLGSILNENYGIYNDADEIDFESLPDSFVVKDTVGSGGNSVILVDDKSKINWDETKKILHGWVNQPVNLKNPGREWVYDGKKHRIIIEKMLVKAGEDLPDYKFFCFDGKPFCLYMMDNYTQHHSEGRLGFLDSNFKLLHVRRADFAPMKVQPPKPLNYEAMVDAAKILSKGFPHVRVDFYNINGKIIFGEMTFFNASGYVRFEPDSFDFELGKQFIFR